MIVLDAYAAIAVLNDEYAAQQVQDLLEGDEVAVLTVLGVAEVVDHLVRLGGLDGGDAALDITQLGLADPPALDGPLATRAGLLRARHYNRRTRAISLADCVAAATARGLNARLATADPALLDTCAAEGIAVIPLPDTTGAVWRG